MRITNELKSYLTDKNADLSNDNAQRNIQLVLARYGLTGGHYQTLQQLADSHGITLQRVQANNLLHVHLSSYGRTAHGFPSRADRCRTYN